MFWVFFYSNHIPTKNKLSTDLIWHWTETNLVSIRVHNCVYSCPNKVNEKVKLTPVQID